MPTTPLNKFLIVCALSLICLLSACSTRSVTSKDQRAPAALPEPTPAPPRLGQPINPLAVLHYLDRECPKLLRQGKFNTNLLAQTPPRTCRLQLAPASPDVLSPTELCHQAEMSTALLAQYSFKDGGVKFAKLSTGFFLTDSGAFVICGHTLESATGSGYFVLTRDGRFCPVQSVLAINKTNDVAVVQVEGDGFAHLPVSAGAPAGSPVWVMSHPCGWLYTFTTGMVSGYMTYYTQTRDGETTWMTMTGDYASGSSGAPILNDHGAVVGVASVTQTLYSFGTERNPQMVLKLCVPSAAVLDLIQQE